MDGCFTEKPQCSISVALHSSYGGQLSKINYLLNFQPIIHITAIFFLPTVIFNAAIGITLNDNIILLPSRRFWNAMNIPWTFVHTWNVEEIKDSWKQEFSEYGFCFVVQCTATTDTNSLDWKVTVQPENECVYTLLVTYEFEVIDKTVDSGKRSFMIEKDILEDECVLLSERLVASANLTVTFRLRVLDTLAAQDLTIRTPYRNFELVCEGKSFYVDVSYLTCLGGSLFTEWNEDYQKGVSRKVIIDLSLSELQCLLDATAKCRQILVTRRNYDEFLQVAFRYGIAQALRMIENFLIDASWIHPIRKLEYAVIYKLARLGDNVSGQLLSSGTAIEVLHRYLAENGETLEQVHPDVLLSLNFHPNYVLI